MLYHGPVRVPDDARPGKAILRAYLLEGGKFESLPTDIPVRLIGAGDQADGNEE